MHQRKYAFFCLLFICNVICVNKDFFMCLSSLFLSNKYQKIDDLFMCNEFSSIFCEQTNCTFHESRGLSRVDVAEKKLFRMTIKLLLRKKDSKGQTKILLLFLIVSFNRKALQEIGYSQTSFN